LEVENIVAGYGKNVVLHGVSIVAEPGSIVGIIGPNGSGKSTLLKAAMGLAHTTSGRVLHEGLDVTSLPPHKRARLGLGYVPQLENVFPSLTVRENLEMGAYAYKGRSEDRIAEVLEYYDDLGASQNRQAQHLSVGQKNMLATARAMVLRPRVLMVDEPTAGVSPQNTSLIMGALSKLADTGVAVIVVEQNVEVALEYSSRCYVLIAGQNYLEGNSDELAMESLTESFLGAGSKTPATERQNGSSPSYAKGEDRGSRRTGGYTT
jgi:ABC-type branched-subunit amino acid transport system ATPase component